MKRLLGCLSLLGATLSGQPAPPAIQSVQSTLLALKDSGAPRKTLSNRLVDQMMAQARQNQVPSRASVQRFSEELTSALLGKDITAVRAAVLQKAILDLMRGRGSTFVPASNLRETLTSCGAEEPTVNLIVQRFIDIGQEVRGPDDIPVRPKFKQF